MIIFFDYLYKALTVPLFPMFPYFLTVAGEKKTKELRDISLCSLLFIMPIRLLLSGEQREQRVQACFLRKKKKNSVPQAKKNGEHLLCIFGTSLFSKEKNNIILGNNCFYSSFKLKR